MANQHKGLAVRVKGLQHPRSRQTFNNRKTLLYLATSESISISKFYLPLRSTNKYSWWYWGKEKGVCASLLKAQIPFACCIWSFTLVLKLHTCSWPLCHSSLKLNEFCQGRGAWCKRKYKLYKCYISLPYPVKPITALRGGCQPAKSPPLGWHQELQTNSAAQVHHRLHPLS